MLLLCGWLQLMGTPLVEVDIFLLLLPVHQLPLAHADGADRGRPFLGGADETGAVPAPSYHSSRLLLLPKLVLRDHSLSDSLV